MAREKKMSGKSKKMRSPAQAGEPLASLHSNIRNAKDTLYETLPPARPKLELLQSAVMKLMKALPAPRKTVKHTVSPVVLDVDWSKVGDVVNGGEYFALCYFAALDLSKSEKTL